MSDVPANIRRDAAILARRKTARSVRFTREAPCEWQPTVVINPEDGRPFTPEAAWQFVATQLEDPRQKVEWVELRMPPHTKALVMVVENQARDIYIKVQLGAGTILGRSFHYSK
jgi:hypothetical protein